MARLRVILVQVTQLCLALWELVENGRSWGSRTMAVPLFDRVQV